MPDVDAHPLDAEIRRLLTAAQEARQGARREGDDLRPLGRKARRTRDGLLTAAYSCFVQNGYRATSVQDIHEAAGVSLGTFYQYFRDKAEVIATMVGEMIVVAADDLFPRLVFGSDGGSTRHVVESFVRNYAESADVQRIWEEVTHIEQPVAQFRWDLSSIIDRNLALSIESGQRAGLVDPGLEPSGTARALGAMVDRYCYRTFVVDDRRDAATVDATVDLLTELWDRILRPA